MTVGSWLEMISKWPKCHGGACPATRYARYCTIVAAATRAVDGCVAVEKRDGRTRAVGKRGERV